ncbi:MAG: DUF167 domain-containing protein [Anaerolineales bacterium]
MASRAFRLHDGKRGAAIAVRITPKASRNEVTEILPDGTIKVRLTESTVDMRGNDALLTFLSEVLGVKKAKMEIVAGETGNDKLISVIDMDTDEVHQRLQAYLG